MSNLLLSLDQANFIPLSGLVLLDELPLSTCDYLEDGMDHHGTICLRFQGSERRRMNFNDDTEAPVSDMVKRAAASIAQNVVLPRRKAAKNAGTILSKQLFASLGARLGPAASVPEPTGGIFLDGWVAWQRGGAHI